MSTPWWQLERSLHPSADHQPSRDHEFEPAPTAHQRRLRTLVAVSQLERAKRRDEGKSPPSLVELVAELIVLRATLDDDLFDADADALDTDALDGGLAPQPHDVLVLAYDHALVLVCQHLGLTCGLTVAGVDVDRERLRLEQAVASRPAETWTRRI